jgi:uncharacterized protein
MQIARPSAMGQLWVGIAMTVATAVAGTGVAWTRAEALYQQQPAPPELTAAVNDFASVISPVREAELDSLSRKLLAASGDVLIVATVSTFKPFATIDVYAREMFKNHGRGIGQRGRDNGLLIVLAVDDRQVRTEVGYGLEGIISDDYAAQIIRETMIPLFKSGDYEGGLVAGATRYAQRLAQARGVTLGGVPVASTESYATGRDVTSPSSPAAR